MKRYIISTKFDGCEYYWCADNRFACMAFTAPIKAYKSKSNAIKMCNKLSHKYATSDFCVWELTNDFMIDLKEKKKVYSIEKV